MIASSGNTALREPALQRLDPRAKILYTALGVLLCLVSARLETLVAILLITQAVLIGGGVPARQVGRTWRGLAILLLLIVIVQPLITPGSGPALVQLGPLRLTLAGVQFGLRTALRLAAAAFLATTPLLTTPIHRLVRGLEKLGLPATWGMTVGLALRYLTTIGELYTAISEAQQARGWDVSQGGLIRRAKASVPTLISVIIASLRLSDSLALGMAARGFGLKRRRTHRTDIAFQWFDWLAVAIIIGGFGLGWAFGI